MARRQRHVPGLRFIGLYTHCGPLLLAKVVPLVCGVRVGALGVVTPSTPACLSGGLACGRARFGCEAAARLGCIGRAAEGGGVALAQF